MNEQYQAWDCLRQKQIALQVDADRCEVLDAAGLAEHDGDLYRMPGFCDLQVNGHAGVDLNGETLTVEMLHEITHQLLREGVTQYCPTLITAPVADLARKMSVIAEACVSDAFLARHIAGIHLEGPFISPVEGARGAHDPRWIRQPDWCTFRELQDAAQGMIRIVTLAPELEGGIDFIHRLAREGVVPAIGHTMASSGMIHAAADAGAKLSTHLGNGIPGMVGRHDNPLTAQLVEDRLVASVIFDGHHLPAEMMKLILRAKRPERMALVSDSTRFSGMEPGVYESSIGGKVQLHANQRLSLYGTEYLAGSASTLRDGAATALFKMGCTIECVVQMCVVQPRHLLGITESGSDVVFTFDLEEEQFNILLVQD